MGFTELKKVVIVTESVIKDKVLDHIISIGAKGYTIDTVCGKGERGIRDDDTLLGEFLRNIKIEVLTTKEIAEKIMTSVVEKFLKNYAGIVYMHDVEVLRPEKFKS